MFRNVALAVAFVAVGSGLFGSPLTQAYDHGAATPSAGAGHEERRLTGSAAAFMLIQNGGAEDDVLLGGETEVADAVEVHEMAEVDGVMEMRPLSDGLVIPAGGEEALEPGGYHIMMFGLREDLTNGKTYDLTLHFEKAGDVTVSVTVRPRAELAAGAAPAAPITVGDLTISDPWSRPAPATGMGDMGTPAATPHS
ncbi:MAG: copper chaperone PCu(A)C [Thermomicrobiales bacterium]|nr:copper chaperone PCu(A)C [Thermomicrobiales bacterium]